MCVDHTLVVGIDGKLWVYLRSVVSVVHGQVEVRQFVHGLPLFRDEFSEELCPFNMVNFGTGNLVQPLKSMQSAGRRLINLLNLRVSRFFCLAHR